MRLSALFETKWIVSGATFATICYRQCDVHSMAFVLGAICNALLGKLLKRLINAARPPGAQLADPFPDRSNAVADLNPSVEKMPHDHTAFLIIEQCERNKHLSRDSIASRNISGLSSRK